MIPNIDRLRVISGPGKYSLLGLSNCSIPRMYDYVSMDIISYVTIEFQISFLEGMQTRGSLEGIQRRARLIQTHLSIDL